MITEPMEQEYDIADQARQKLMSVVPEAFADGKILWEKLRESLGDMLDDDDETAFEHYGLNWPGKRKAKKVAATPSTLTLTPLKGEGIDEDTTENIFIEGDNLEVLKILYKSYKEKIKMIYIDPPYNTGNDFVYNDNFRMTEDEFMRAEGSVDEQGNRLVANKKTSGRFHANWLNMMYPRLKIARELLRDDGIIFISIDDNEVHNLKLICDEIFGEENYLSQFSWRTDGNFDNQAKIKNIHEYILLYAKNTQFFTHPPVIDPSVPSDSKLFREEIRNTIIKNGPKNPISSIEIPSGFPAEIQEGIIDARSTSWPHYESQAKFANYKLLNPVLVSSGWSSKDLLISFIANNCEPVLDSKGQLTRFVISRTGAIEAIKIRSDMQSHVISSLSGFGGPQKASAEIAELGVPFDDYPKPVDLIKYLIQMNSGESFIVMDFFAGSGTTAHAVMELCAEKQVNYNFISIQLPETIDQKKYKATYDFCVETLRSQPVISELTKERIRRVSLRVKQKNANFMGDAGFKVYKTTRSNHKVWGKYFVSSTKDIDGLFKKHQHSLIDGWTYDSVLTEIILTEGFPLTSFIESLSNITSNKVVQVSCPDKEYALIICLDESIMPDTIKAIGMNDNDIFVCLGSAIDDQNLSALHDKGRIRTL